MGVRLVTLSEMKEPIRSFLAQVVLEGGLVVDDEAGRVHLTAVRSTDPEVPIPDRYEEFMARLAPIHQVVGESMRSQGITEDDIDRLLQENEP